MNRNPYRLLVVDDSSLVRAIIRDIVEPTGDFEVVGEADDGNEALRLAARLRPDLITLDVEMPGLDGLSTLDRLIEEGVHRVIMVSMHTQRQAEVTLDALNRGALDYVAKPSSQSLADGAFATQLLHSLRTMATANPQRILRIRRERASRQPASHDGLEAARAKSFSTHPRFAVDCIAIGVSTGGPPALARLFGELQPPLPPIVVVQHMPADFTGPFAQRLDALSQLAVKEAKERDLLTPNTAVVAPGGRHLSVCRQGDLRCVNLSDSPPVSGHRPSVDVLMESAAAAFGPRCLGVIMTGMGYDGVAGCAALKKAGAPVLGQDEETSDVYGMNKAAFVAGHVDRQVPFDHLATTITSIVRAPAIASRTSKA